MNIEEKIKDALCSRASGWSRHSPKRVYFSVRKEDILETAKLLFKELGMRFSIASATDTPQGIEILYHFSFDKTGEIFSIRVLLEDKKSPKIDSIAPLFPAAEWIEREMWELLGIEFSGHPNLKHLLLVDDWPAGKYPLRHER